MNYPISIAAPIGASVGESFTWSFLRDMITKLTALCIHVNPLEENFF